MGRTRKDNVTDWMLVIDGWVLLGLDHGNAHTGEVRVIEMRATLVRMVR